MTQHATKHRLRFLHMRPVGMWSKSAALIVGTVALLMMAGGQMCRAESTPLVLLEDSSTILEFQHMSRVWVVDPEVVDVAVTTFNELLVHAKSAGHTKLYVWDKAGRHEYAVVVKKQPAAERLAMELRELLGNRLRFTVLDDNSLMIEGEVDRASERDRLEKIIKNRAGDVEIVDLIVVKDANLTPAERSAKALRQVLGDKYQYLLWDDNTVIVQGQADSAEELARVRAIISAANKGEHFASAVVLSRGGSGEPPIGAIAAAVGPQYHVWQLRGRTVVVEGEAPNEAAKARVDSLLQAFDGEAEIINLVRVTSGPKVPLAAQRDLLQAALGEDSGIQVRVVKGKALVVEGTVPDEDALKRTEKLLALFSQTPVVNLVRVVAPNKRQVLVHVKVVDTTRGALEQYGVTWGQIMAGEVRDQPYVVKVEGGLDNLYDVGALLDALVRNNEARILAQPNLLVNDGEHASFVAGGEVPIPVPQVSGGASSITIEYKEYGVKLDIAPTIRPSEGKGKPPRIELEVTPEVSSVDTATQVAIGGLTVPAFKTRRAKTKVDIYSGQTLMIGGLLSRDQSRVVTKIPILGDLPIIGEFFRHREFKNSQGELIILVTPEVVEPRPNSQ